MLEGIQAGRVRMGRGLELAGLHEMHKMWEAVPGDGEESRKAPGFQGSFLCSIWVDGADEGHGMLLPVFLISQ